MSAVADARGRRLSEPGFITALFNDTRFSIIWLVVRLFVGYQWITAGLHKFEDPAWMSTGQALAGFWKNALVTTPSPKITYGWYHDFIQALLNGGHYVWFAKLITLGELAIGVALIVGAFVGVAAFFGAFMNLNFMLAGSASTNPVLFLLAALLILAWKTAGYLGADYVILRYVEPLWQRPAMTMRAETMPRIAGGGESPEN